MLVISCQISEVSEVSEVSEISENSESSEWLTADEVDGKDVKFVEWHGALL